MRMILTLFQCKNWSNSKYRISKSLNDRTIEKVRCWEHLMSSNNWIPTQCAQCCKSLNWNWWKIEIYKFNSRLDTNETATSELQQESPAEQEEVTRVSDTIAEENEEEGATSSSSDHQHSFKQSHSQEKNEVWAYMNIYHFSNDWVKQIITKINVTFSWKKLQTKAWKVADHLVVVADYWHQCVNRHNKGNI